MYSNINNSLVTEIKIILHRLEKNSAEMRSARNVSTDRLPSTF